MLSDSGRYAPRIDEIAGILKWLKDETSTDLTALEKDELDRKTKHQGLVKAEPRPARLPPTREKLQSTGMHERSCATVEMSFESAQQRFNVVTCILVQRHEAASQEGVMNFHLCLSIPINSLWEALEMKAWSPEKFVDVSDVKVLDEDGFLSLQHDDQSKEHHHEGANLDQSCRSARSCFQYLHTEPRGCEIHSRKVSNEIRVNWKTFPVCGPIQGVQDCTCECPRSQAGTRAAIHRRKCLSGRALTLRFVMLVVRSFNGVVQCTIDFSGHVLHARIDRDVYVSDPWHTASNVIW